MSDLVGYNAKAFMDVLSTLVVRETVPLSPFLERTSLF